MAAAHAAAAASGQPLYRYLGGPDVFMLPLPQIQIFGGGAHAGRRVDIQDFLVVCPAAKTFAEAVTALRADEAREEACRCLRCDIRETVAHAVSRA